MEVHDLLRRIDGYKSLIDSCRPLGDEEARQLDDYYRIGLTYTSNALEGNTLTLTETKVLIEDGLTVGGKPMKDALEAVGHARAYDFMLTQAHARPLLLTEATITELHRLFYMGINPGWAGVYRTHQVLITGTDYIPPAPSKVPGMMERFVTDLNAQTGSIHPVALAAYAHRRLVDIHPFIDGNGRTARLLMNLILINQGYQIVSIPPVLRHDYITALQTAQQADHPSDQPFQTLIARCEFEAQRDYCRMFDLPEPPTPADSPGFGSLVLDRDPTEEVSPTANANISDCEKAGPDGIRANTQGRR